MIKYYLLGRHSHRTPLSYQLYIDRSKDFFLKVEEPEIADVVILGFIIDIKENKSRILELVKVRPHLKFIVLSEEPLWDTVWSGNYLKIEHFIDLDGTKIKVNVVNHFNSDVYTFSKIPYYITTESKFISRYRTLFRRNLKFGVKELAQHFKLCAREAYFLENRSDLRYSFRHNDATGLSVFRSELAKERKVKNKKNLIVGKGWDNERPRQKLVDWHADKLASLDKRFRFCSAIENTDVTNYISEKYFDALAVLSFPIIATEKNTHNLFRGEKSPFINVDINSKVEAGKEIDSFAITVEIIEAYRENINYWLEIFNSIEICENEYRSRLERIYMCLLNILNNF